MRKSISALFVHSLFGGSRRTRPHFGTCPIFLTLATLLVLTFTPGFAYAQSPFSTNVTSTVGSGSNESYLVVNFDNGPGGVNEPSSNFVFGYLWGGPTNPNPTGYTMIQDLNSANVLSSTLTDYAGFGPQGQDEHFVDQFTFGSITSGNPQGYDPATGSFWNYFLSSTSQLAGSSSPWPEANYGPDIYALTPGSVDGWVWEPGNDVPVVPSVAAAPESSTWMSMIVGLAIVASLSLARLKGRNREAGAE